MIYFVTNQKSITTEHSEEIKYGTIKDCLAYFKDKEIIEVDTETEFCAWNKSRMPDAYTAKVLSLQLGDSENQFVFDTGNVDITPLKPLFADNNKLKIFCNASFDLRFFHHWGFKVSNVYDVFLAECVLTKGKPFEKGYKSLKSMAMRYLDIELDKEIRGQIYWKGLDHSVIKYAAGDVTYMSLIREKQTKLIDEMSLGLYLRMENRYVIDLSLMSYHGFKLNPERWLKVKEENLKTKVELLKQLDDYVVSRKYHKFIDITLFGDRCAINWNSPKQTIPLFDMLGINLEIRDKKTSKMRKSVDIKNLKKQKSKFDILPIYIEYKEIDKEITTYGEAFLKENLNPGTGRIHSEFYQILETSRLSSNKPNMQNIPAETKEGHTHPLRKAFEPEKGNTFVICDFSQQEPRITADFSQDPVLIDFMMNGDGDMHSFVSTLISPKLLGKEIKVSKTNNPMVPQFGQPLRSVGKDINLGLDYGKTAYSLKDDLGCSQEEAQDLIDFLASRTPVKQKYFKAWQNFVKQHGYIVSDNTLGCITYFDKYAKYLELSKTPMQLMNRQMRSEFYKVKGQLERFAQNNRIQNTGALMTKTAHILVNDRLKEKGWMGIAFMVNAVHDELVAECRKDIAEEVSKIIVDSMVEAGAMFCKTVPMVVDPVISNFWTH